MAIGLSERGAMMGQVIDALAIGVLIFLVILGAVLIFIPLGMSSSDDLAKKIEGIISAPLLIPAGVGVIALAAGIIRTLLRRSP